VAEDWVRALGGHQPALLQAVTRPEPALPELEAFADSEERIQSLARLGRLGPDLTEAVGRDRFPRPLLLRLDLLEELVRLLAQGRSVLLVGEPGVGRRTLLWQLAYAMAAGLPGFPLGRRPLHLVPADAFQFGVFYMHELETKVRLAAAEALRLGALLAVADAELLVWAGARDADDPRTVANLLGPSLDQGLRLVGVTTPEGYRLMERVNPPFCRRFVRLEVPALSPGATRRLLAARFREVPAREGQLFDEALEAAAWLGEPLPGGPLRLLEEAEALGAGGLPGREGLYGAVCRRTGLCRELVDPWVCLPAESVRGFLGERIYGQEEAVEAVVDVILRVKAGLNDPGRPWGVLLLVGPSGVGKTELARQAAAFLFGSEERLVRCDMGALVGPEGLGRFLRTAVEEVGARPCSVVLLDEIEKTDAYLKDALLSILGEARITDARGRTVSFRNCLIFLTSNVGSELYGQRRPSLGPGLPARALEGMVRARLGERFRPEFLNRVDRVVCFRPLTAEVVRRIAEREVRRVEARLRRRRPGLRLAVAGELLERCAAEGWDPTWGARPIRRVVEQRVAGPVGRFLGANPWFREGVLRLGVGPGGAAAVMPEPHWAISQAGANTGCGPEPQRQTG
jgi:ATP-dependent Clp protease ATP-binding subunit ClpC